MLFFGKYEHSVDAKHRIAIPSEIRSQIDTKQHGEGFFVIMGPNGALWVWPEKTFEKMVNEVNAKQELAPDPEQMDFDEITFPEAARAVPDKVGRIRIPEHMLEDAGISNRAVVLGMRNHLEIRDPEDWERRRQEKAKRRPEIVQAARRSNRENRSTKD